MTRSRQGHRLRVGVVGCGAMGRKRAGALDGDELVACCDLNGTVAEALARDHGATPTIEFAALLEHQLDVVVVAVTHDQLAAVACSALEAGAHVLVEKPAGIGTADVDRIARAARATGRRAKVGFNHRFHPGIARTLEEAGSGRFGDVMFVRARYGHGGRVGYDREWRMRPELSGGGELTDQGMHLLDLFHELLGPLPLASALLRTQFWSSPVEDNAVLVLAEPDAIDGAWGTFHVSWTEWKNLFSLEVYCRTAKLRVEGLTGSYGTQRLWRYEMRPGLGPPDIEEIAYPPGDPSWVEEWRHFREAVRAEDDRPLLGDLHSARYAWACVEEAYERCGYPRRPTSDE